MSLDAKPSVAAEQLQAAVREASMAACSLSFARVSRWVDGRGSVVGVVRRGVSAFGRPLLLQAATDSCVQDSACSLLCAKVSGWVEREEGVVVCIEEGVHAFPNPLLLQAEQSSSRAAVCKVLPAHCRLLRPASGWMQKRVDGEGHL
eukprot:1159363-Pelagomonas_calceolata.AAC.8